MNRGLGLADISCYAYSEQTTKSYCIAQTTVFNMEKSIFKMYIYICLYIYIHISFLVGSKPEVIIILDLSSEYTDLNKQSIKSHLFRKLQRPQERYRGSQGP